MKVAVCLCIVATVLLVAERRSTQLMRLQVQDGWSGIRFNRIRYINNDPTTNAVNVWLWARNGDCLYRSTWGSSYLVTSRNHPIHVDQVVWDPAQSKLLPVVSYTLLLDDGPAKGPMYIKDLPHISGVAIANIGLP